MAYKVYQEIIGEIYYEVLGLGFLARAISVDGSSTWMPYFPIPSRRP
ncbi:MAG: hypothetical protein MZV70_48800 [Desulfobacterales bacterium]|nr:hypothetical protein [Desulfobacterales bacterium]